MECLDTHIVLSMFVQATEELKGQLKELKFLYGSSIKYFDELEGELHGNSELAYRSLKSEISKNSTSLMDVSNAFFY